MSLKPECNICLGEIRSHDNIAAPVCGHTTHTRCIVPWLDRELTCPTCRRAVNNITDIWRVHLSFGIFENPEQARIQELIKEKEELRAKHRALKKKLKRKMKSKNRKLKRLKREKKKAKKAAALVKRRQHRKGKRSITWKEKNSNVVRICSGSKRPGRKEKRMADLSVDKSPRTTTSRHKKWSQESTPTKKTYRFRGRQLNATPQPSEEATAAVAEDRLPANTRFPPRSRSNHNSATVTSQAPDESVPSRGRSPAGNAAAAPTNSVRHPSLELVDSSSFRTHSSDVSRNQDQQPPSFPTVLPAGPFRFLGVTPNEESTAERDGQRTRNNKVQGREQAAPVSEEEREPENANRSRRPYIRRSDAASCSSSR